MRSAKEALKILTDAINSPNGTDPDKVVVFAQRFCNAYSAEHTEDCSFEYNGHVTEVWALGRSNRYFLDGVYPIDVKDPAAEYVTHWGGKHETNERYHGRTFAEAVTDFAGVCDYFDNIDEIMNEVKGK